MTTKAECLAKATESEEAAKAEAGTVAALTVAFGGADEVTLQSKQIVRRHQDQAMFWYGLARLDSKDRRRQLRRAAGL